MASVEELIIKLSADNTDLKRKIGESEKTVGGFGNALKGIGLAAGIGFAAAGMAALAFGKQAFKAAEAQEQANKRLMFAVRGNVLAFKDLTNQAEQLRAATGVDDAAIMQIQQLGANAGYSTDKIKKVTEAAVELAAATGQDLQSAYMQINATFNGSAGRLTRLDSEFGTLTKEQLKNGDAVDLILTKYKGFAAASATETQKLSSNWDEFTERLGGYTLPAVNSFFNELNTRLRITSDNALSFWEKLTIPPAVYNDIQRQKKAFEESGKTATTYYRGILGVNSALSGFNALIKEGEGKGAVIKPKDTKEIKESTKAIDSWVEAYEKMLELQQFDVPQERKGGIIAAMQGKTNATVPTKAGGGLKEQQGLLPGTSELDKNAYGQRLQQLKDFLEQGIINYQEYSEGVKAINAEMNQALYDGTYNILGNLSSLFEEQTIAYKVFASAMALMDTYKAANAAYAAMAGIPVIGPGLGIAAAAAAIAAGLGNVGKITGAFAQGGIVGGGSYTGDQMTARVNSGEMILNGRQQSELFAMANGMGGGQRIEIYGEIAGDVIRLSNKRSMYIANKRG